MIYQITIKQNIMTTFNQKMTIEEATKLFQFAGKLMYPDTIHNRKIMALVANNHLKKLQGK